MKAIFQNLILLISFLATSVAGAGKFSNAFISFDPPDGWDCNLQETEWVCKSRADKAAQEAVIIFTAKEAGPTDTVDSYTRHLATPQKSAARGGGRESVVVLQPKTIVINGHPWLESTHRDSEIKDYFTRYLVTVKNNRIAIAVTFSAHKDAYAKYKDAMFRSAQSIEVIAAKTRIVAPETANIPGGPKETIGVPVSPGPNDPLPAPRVQGQKTKAILFVLAILLAAGALYVFLRTRKN